MLLDEIPRKSGGQRPDKETGDKNPGELIIFNVIFYWWINYGIRLWFSICDEILFSLVAWYLGTGNSGNICPKKYPILKRRRGASNHDHGDVCKRKEGGSGYNCPKSCYKTANGNKPFCRASKKTWKPCRVWVTS